MAYLFQSGSLNVQLSGGMNFNYSTITSSRDIVIDQDGVSGSAGGKLYLGEYQQGLVYATTSSVVLDGAVNGRVSFYIGGSRKAFADSNGLTIEAVTGAPSALYVDVNNVLSQTDLGPTVTGSSLTSLGTIASLVATTADINAGTVDAVIGGTTPAAGSFTTLSGSSTLIVDGSGSFNNGVTFKAGTEITLGVSGDTALDVAADGLYFADATDGFVKTIAIGSFLTDIAGSGLSVVSNQLEAAGGAETVNDPIGNENATLLVGMNWGTSSFNANRVWTLPACSTLNKGDVLRIKAPTLGGYTLTVSPNAVDAIDDLADDVDVELGSDNASISLMVVSGSGIGLIWKII